MAISCNVCNGTAGAVFSARVLNKYEVTYYRCTGCGLLQTQEPFWLSEAYAEPIAAADTGLLSRNISLASRLAVLLHLRFDPKAAYLDIAGGYGVLTRLMRDYGFDFYWQDDYSPNLFGRGFGVTDSKRSFAALTAIEVLEHVHEPLEFLREHLAMHGADTVIFTTELYDGNSAPPENWWYYTFDIGQHVSFYQLKTLQKLAGRLRMNFYSLSGLHVLTKHELHISPSLRVAIGTLAPFLAPYVRRRLGSRTLTDHNGLLDRQLRQP